MPIQTLTDATWREAIGARPALILFSTGDGLRGEFVTAFRKAADQHTDLVFGEINPARNEQVAQTFTIGDKPVLIAYLDGDVLTRRQRPWGSDVTLAVELLQQQAKERQPQMPEPAPILSQEEPKTIMDNKPFKVTDETFQQEVIDYSHTTPVLVDFWAEWCGPCRTVAPVLDKLAQEFAGRIRIAKVNTDENPGLSQAFRVMSIPNFMAFKDGQLVFNQPGAFPEPVFRDLIQQLLVLDVQAAMAQAQQKQNQPPQA